MTGPRDKIADWGDRSLLMRISSNADQAERDAMRLGNAPVAAGLEDERVVGIFDDDAVENEHAEGDDWEAEDEAIEIAEGDALEEIENRAELLGEHYPFVLNGTALHYKPSQTGIYEFCLAASIADSIKRKPFNRIPIAFEHIAAEAVRQYLGRGSIAIRTGWPPHNKVERPTKFKAMAALLSEKTGEWLWSPRHPDPDDPHPKKVKDAGIDFIAWKPMPDQRPGKLFLLGQCACGNDWDTKLHDPNQEELDRWFRPATYAPFQKAFAMPRPITSQRVFSVMGLQAKGIVFDRMRLTALAESAPDDFARWRADLSSLTAMVIPPPAV